jgi:hypothetical protein
MIIFYLKIKSLIHSCKFSPFLGLQIKTSQQLSQASAGWIKLECISHVVCQPIFCVITRSWIRESFQNATDVRAKGPWSPPSHLYDGYQVIPGEAEWLGHVINHPSPTSAKVKERVKLPLLPLWAFTEGYRMKFTSPFTDVNATNNAYI